MLVFDISSAKTGTTSLARALSMLGFKSCHGCPEGYEEDTMSKLLQNDMRFKLLEDFDAVCGLLNFAYYQIERHYPEAKFIYLDRNEDEWVNSTLRQLHANNHSETKEIKKMNIMQYCRIQNIGCMHTEDGEYLKERFLRRKKEILDHFKFKNNFLMMSVRCGWEPLCEFLEKQVPSLDFPKLNSSKERSKFLNQKVF